MYIYDLSSKNSLQLQALAASLENEEPFGMQHNFIIHIVHYSLYIVQHRNDLR